MVTRASLFRFPWMAPWVYVLLFGAVAVVGPWTLWRALASVSDDDSPGAANRRG